MGAGVGDGVGDGALGAELGGELGCVVGGPADEPEDATARLPAIASVSFSAHVLASAAEAAWNLMDTGTAV